MTLSLGQADKFPVQVSESESRMILSALRHLEVDMIAYQTKYPSSMKDIEQRRERRKKLCFVATLRRRWTGICTSLVIENERMKRIEARK